MNKLAPFPSDVDLGIERFVSRWYVVVRYWESSLMAHANDGIVMMYPCKTYVDALLFVNFYTR